MKLSQEDRPKCVTEGCKASAKKGGTSSKGFQLYKKLCSLCEDKKYNIKRKSKWKPEYGDRKYNGYKKNTKCESCGFVAKHRCQLDVDHIDGNSFNNTLENLQTLCANCHRLKTWINKDWQQK